jgi:hypothetical protein
VDKHGGTLAAAEPVERIESRVHQSVLAGPPGAFPVSRQIARPLRGLLRERAKGNAGLIHSRRRRPINTDQHAHRIGFVAIGERRTGPAGLEEQRVARGIVCDETHRAAPVPGSEGIGFAQALQMGPL